MRYKVGDRVVISNPEATPNGINNYRGRTATVYSVRGKTYGKPNGWYILRATPEKDGYRVMIWVLPEQISPLYNYQDKISKHFKI